MSIEEIERAAMALPDGERVRLGEKLLASAGVERVSDIEAAWGQLADARMAEIERGEAVVEDGEAVRRRLADRKR